MKQTMPTKQQGKLTANGVVLEKHEMATVVFLSQLGFDIELIRPSLTPGSKNPDFYMNGLTWEMKSPKISTPSRLAVLFHKATKQSPNIIFDLRRLKDDASATRILCKIAATSHSVKNFLIITKSHQILNLRGNNIVDGKSRRML